jgi:proline dehydrogenase
MPNRLLLLASENKRLERAATTNRFTRPLVERYVAGETLEDALRVTEELNSRGIRVSLDLLGESVEDLQASDGATEDYALAIARMAGQATDSTVSVKLSQLGILVSPEHARANLLRLLEVAREHGCSVEVDMEHSSVGRATLDVFKSLLAQYPETRLALQANMRATSHDLRDFTETLPRIRLVKGAFDEHLDVALRSPVEVTSQYRYLSRWALAHLPDPAFGTHDDSCVDEVQRTAGELGLDKRAFEFQMLYGVRRSLQEQLVQEGYRVRVYLPYGTHWYPYLTRRMAERPANLLLFLRSVIGD